MKTTRVIPIAAPPEELRRQGAAAVSVPGESVSALQCQIPANLRGKKAQNVALQAVQDLVASPAGLNAYVVLPGTGATRTVLVTSRTQLDEWIALKSRHKLRVPVLLPDYLCLPWAENTMTVSAPEADRLVVRTGESAGFAGERDLVLKMLQQARTRQAVAVKSIGLIPETARDDIELMAELNAWGVPIGPAGTAVNLPYASLLTGAGQGVRLGPRARRLAILAVVGIAAVALWAINADIEIRSYQSDISAQRQANTAFVRDKIGLNGPIVDLRVQVDRALDDLQRTASESAPRLGLADMVRAVGPVLSDEGVDVREMRYGDAALIVGIEIADFAALEKLRKDLGGSGLSAEILRSVGSGTDGVRAELRVAQEGDER